MLRCTALFIAVAACTYLLPKSAVKPLQRVFILIVFSLVGEIQYLMHRNMHFLVMILFKKLSWGTRR